MVKKRNRDPEVLAEAPEGEEYASGSDTVSWFLEASAPCMLTKS